MPINEHGNLPLTELSSDRCPHCGTSLINGETHARREIGMETDDYDGILFYVCPDCHRGWSRFLGEGSFSQLAKRHVAEHNRGVADADRDRDRICASVDDHVDAIEEVLASYGLSAPHGWRYGPYAAEVTLFVHWEDVDAARWDDLVPTSRRLTEIVGWRTRVHPLINRGVHSWMCVQYLMEADPWAGGSLDWVHRIARGTRANEIAFEDVGPLVAEHGIVHEPW